MVILDIKDTHFSFSSPLSGEITEHSSSTWKSEAVSLCFLHLSSWRSKPDWRLVLQRSRDWSHQQHSCLLQCITSDQFCGFGQHCISRRASECWCWHPVHLYLIIKSLYTHHALVTVPLSFAACTGLHHIHWLQHFISLLDCLHHIFHITEVS